MKYPIWQKITTAQAGGSNVTHKDGKVFIDGRLVYDSFQQEDQTLYTDEEELKLRLYASALEELATEDRRYNSNYNLWQRWDKAVRLWWIAQIEKQAREDKKTIGAVVVSRAVEIRLTRS